MVTFWILGSVFTLFAFVLFIKFFVGRRGINVLETFTFLVSIVISAFSIGVLTCDGVKPFIATIMGA